jgi:hypothetical protein
MIFSMNSGVPQTFPPQKKSDAQKTEKYLKSCVDAGVDLVNWELNSGYRKSKSEMVRLYGMVNGIIDPGDKKKITNPLDLEGQSFPGTAQTYPLITPLFSVLTGEEKNRLHFIDVNVVNHDAISSKQEYLKKQLDDTMVKGIQDTSASQEQLEEEMRNFGKWSKYTYRDRRERMAHQIISYLKVHQEMNFKFSRGFEDFLIVGEEVFITDIIAGEPIVRKANPLNMSFVRSNESPYPEDSDLIIEDGYLSISKVLDEYYDVLKDKDIKRLEEGSSLTGQGKNSLWSFQNKQSDVNLDDLLLNTGGSESVLGTPSNGAKFGLSGAFDKHGRVRRTRVLWKSMRKIGVLPYVDENGDNQEVIVPEQYEPNKAQNEEIEWQWISEWWEGTRIADDIYVKMQPRPVQFREMSNLSKCSPGVVGIINNINSSKVTSFVSSIKPIQYLYDEFMYRLQTAFMTSYGNIARLDVSQIPDGWSMDKWLYYATTMKWAIQDPMKEGEEGAARGKLSGGMNQPANAYNLDQGNLIQQNMAMMEFLERRANDVAGITPQRKGSTSNRETVGGIERAVVQSSHRTEKWFSLHDHVKLRVYKMMIETAKVAWKKDKFKRSFFMGDMTQSILDFDGEQFNEAEYGVMVNNSKEDTNIKSLLESSRDIMLQTGFQLSDVIGILRTDNISTMYRKIEQKEEEIEKARAKQEKAITKQADDASQRDENVRLEELAMKERNNVRDNQTKVLVASDDTDNDGANDDDDNDVKISADLQKHKDKMELDGERLKETIRTNRRNETLKEKSINKVNKQTSKK